MVLYALLYPFLVVVFVSRRSAGSIFSISLITNYSHGDLALYCRSWNDFYTLHKYRFALMNNTGLCAVGD